MSKKKQANIEDSVKIFFLYFQKNYGNNISNLQFSTTKNEIILTFWVTDKRILLDLSKMCVKLQFIDVFLNENAFKFRFAI